MNLILTMNTGGKWTPENVRDSHLAAARRWGAEYRELTAPSDDVFWDKHMALARVTDAERLLWIDGDVIVREDCPSPFEHVDETSVAAVRCFQQPNPEAVEIARDWWRPVVEHMDIEVKLHQSTYVNGGFIVCTPAYHGDLFRFVLRWCNMIRNPINPVRGMLEQTVLNIGLQVMGLSWEVLESEWGLLGSDAWAPGAMSAPVQHLAWTTGHQDGKRAALEAIDWRLPVGVT